MRVREKPTALTRPRWEANTAFRGAFFVALRATLIKTKEILTMPEEGAVATIMEGSSEGAEEAITPSSADPVDSSSTETPESTFVESIDSIATSAEDEIPTDPTALAALQRANSPEEAQKTDGDDTKEGKGKEKAASTEGEDDLDTRFDKHPRFQQLNQKAKDAEATANRALQEAETLRQQLAAQPQPLDFTDISQMSEDQIEEAWDTNRQQFLGNLARQVRHEVLQEVNHNAQVAAQTQAEQSSRDNIIKAFTDYAEANPDFDTMWDKGDIQKFMDKNPGHNAIAAHQALTMEAKITAASTKAAKEAREAAEKDFAVGRRPSSLLGAGPVNGGNQHLVEGDTVLKDTKQHGGLTSALVTRLRARRAAQMAR